MEEVKRYTWVKALSPRFSKHSAHVGQLEYWAQRQPQVLESAFSEALTMVDGS
jgi:hypothetical protein